MLESVVSVAIASLMMTLAFMIIEGITTSQSINFSDRSEINEELEQAELNLKDSYRQSTRYEVTIVDTGVFENVLVLKLTYTDHFGKKKTLHKMIP